MEFVLSICLGLGLSAACGFRVFVPLLGISIASLSGHLTLANGFEWMGSWPAFACFLTATILEVAGYYVPWIDNLLDSIATPAAMVAGAIVTASVVGDMSPLMRWSLAVIAGGAVAGVVQTSTVALRGGSTLVTGGLANFAVSTGELGMSSLMTVLAFTLPLLAIALVVALLGVAIWAMFFRTSRIAERSATNA